MDRNKSYEPEGFLNEIHRGFHDIAGKFKGQVCSEVFISASTYRSWLRRPDLISVENMGKVALAAQNLVNDLQLLVAALFKEYYEMGGKPIREEPAANA